MKAVLLALFSLTAATIADDNNPFRDPNARPIPERKSQWIRPDPWADDEWDDNKYVQNGRLYKCVNGPTGDNNPCLHLGFFDKCTYDNAERDEKIEVCYGKATRVDLQGGWESKRACADICHNRCIDPGIRAGRSWVRCHARDGAFTYCGVYYGDNLVDPGWHEPAVCLLTFEIFANLTAPGRTVMEIQGKHVL